MNGQLDGNHIQLVWYKMVALMFKNVLLLKGERKKVQDKNKTQGVMLFSWIYTIHSSTATGSPPQDTQLDAVLLGVPSNTVCTDLEYPVTEHVHLSIMRQD